MESSAVAFIVRGALRADRLAVRPLSAQCGAALRSISAAVRSILSAVRCSAVDFHTALRSISPVFDSKSQPRTGHTREHDPTHNELKHTITRKTATHERNPFSTAVRSANTAQGYRSAVEFRRTATSPSNRAPPSYWETPSYYIPTPHPINVIN